MSNPTSGPQEAVIPATIQANFPDVRNWLRKIDLNATTDTDENTDIVAQIMQGVLSATTEEEIFAAQNAGIMSAKDYTYQPFRLTSENISWRRSSIETSVLPFYAVIKVTDLSDGEEKVVGCGGPTFMVVLDKLAELGALDRKEDDGEGRPLQIITKRTNRGFDVLLLAPVNLGKTKNGQKG